jgi:hypothetical protein
MKACSVHTCVLELTVARGSTSCPRSGGFRLRLGTENHSLAEDGDGTLVRIGVSVVDEKPFTVTAGWTLGLLTTCAACTNPRTWWYRFNDLGRVPMSFYAQ